MSVANTAQSIAITKQMKGGKAVTQESVRNRLIKYIAEKGVKLVFISRKIDVPDYLMAKFKTAKRELWQESLDRLDEFLKAENY